MGTAAGSEPEWPETSGGAPSGIQVTRAVNSALREMRAADPRKAKVVDAAIRSIPHVRGEPVRIDVPGVPPDREYRAIIPDGRDAPVVIYRRLRPEDSVAGDWVVTTLIDRDEYEEYLHAERRGIVDSPEVRHITGSVIGEIVGIDLGEASRRPGGQSGTG